MIGLAFIERRCGHLYVSTVGGPDFLVDDDGCWIAEYR